MKKLSLEIILWLLRKTYVKSFFCYQTDSRSSTNMYISYIADVFYRTRNKKYLNGHQGRKEIIAFSNVLKQKKINHIIEDFNKSTRFLDKPFDIVFGLEPNFVTIAEANPSAKKIYYATGAYWVHQNNMIKGRTDEVNKKYQTHLPYSRLVQDHKSSEIADQIIQIGSNYTIETYPEHLRNKITLIDQSSYEFNDINIEHKKKVCDPTHFIWFGSGGSVLKGVDLVLEVFSKKPELTLHVVGPIDKEFSEQILPYFSHCRNILFYGYMNVYSTEFRNLANKSAYMIYPSGSEGCPGSVINLMKLGVIPIVSKYATFNGIENAGYILEKLSTAEIEAKIDIVLKLTKSEINQKISECSNITCARFTISNYEKQISNLFNLDSL